MTEGEVAAIVRGLVPAVQQHIDQTASEVVNRAIETFQQEAKHAEELRQAQFRADLAERMNAVIELEHKVALRLAEIKDGTDGKDGRDGRDADMDVLAKQVETLVAAIPVPENGKDGRDGEPGPQGEPGPAGKDGEQGPAGSDGVNGADGRDGADGQDADMEALAEQVRQYIATIPLPENGKDGADAYPGEAKGLFDPEATYRALDVVSFNGSEWRAKKDDPGPLPGDGWMLSASKGKRGDRGEKGDRGMEGKPGKDGAQPIGLKFDADEMKFVMVLDDGNQLDADFYPIVKAIRGEEV